MKPPLIIALLLILFAVSVNAQWVKLIPPITYDTKQVFFVNESVGYIITNGNLLKTTDGGISWDEIRFDGWETSIYFINENIGFIAAAEGLKKTNNGGLNWTTNSEFNNLFSVHFFNDSIGYAGGNSEMIKTMDQGETWNIVLDGHIFRSVFAADSLTVYAFGFLAWDNFGFKSIDGGNTWQTLNMGYDFRFVNSYFSNSNIGFVIGWDLGTSYLLKTINGGNSWELVWQSQIELSSVYFLNEITGYLVGGYYLPNSLPILWKTTDGGLTWIDQNPASNVSDAIFSIQFVNDCLGYAVGENGLILKTVNAGDSTLCKEIPPPLQFELKQNYPNPFNKQTIIEYELPVESNIELIVYNVLGEKVKTLVNQSQTSGKKKVLWNGTDDQNKILSSGLYVYILKTNKHRYFKKLVFLK